MGKIYAMEKVNNLWVYKIPDEVCRKMLQKAKNALVSCFPEAYHGFAVTVLTKNGNIYAGVSYKSDTYTLTMHSEATALAHAAIHQEKEIIAITGPNCHICKQLLWENSLRSSIDIIVVLKKKGKIKKVPLSKMMPYPWPERKSDEIKDK
jgi:cytidine deaminase